MASWALLLGRSFLRLEEDCEADGGSGGSLSSLRSSTLGRGFASCIVLAKDDVKKGRYIKKYRQFFRPAVEDVIMARTTQRAPRMRARAGEDGKVVIET